jgi:hypothetical protein
VFFYFDSLRSGAYQLSGQNPQTVPQAAKHAQLEEDMIELQITERGKCFRRGLSDVLRTTHSLVSGRPEKFRARLIESDPARDTSLRPSRFVLTK